MGQLTQAVMEAVSARSRVLEGILTRGESLVTPFLECDFKLSVEAERVHSLGQSSYSFTSEDFLITSLTYPGLVSWNQIGGNASTVGLYAPGVSVGSLSLSYYRSDGTDAWSALYDSFFTSKSSGGYADSSYAGSITRVGRDVSTTVDDSYLGSAGLLRLPGNAPKISIFLTVSLRTSQIQKGVSAALLSLFSGRGDRAVTDPVLLGEFTECRLSTPTPTFNPGSSNPSTYTVQVFFKEFLTGEFIRTSRTTTGVMSI